MYVLPSLNWHWIINISTTYLILVECFLLQPSESPRWPTSWAHEETVRHLLERIALVNGNKLLDGRVTLIDGESTALDHLETGTDGTVPSNSRQQPADPFTSREALISASINPTSAAGCAGFADISSDFTLALLKPRAALEESDDPENSANKQEVLDEGRTELRPRRKGVAELLQAGVRQLPFWILVFEIVYILWSDYVADRAHPCGKYQMYWLCLTHDHEKKPTRSS